MKQTIDYYDFRDAFARFDRMDSFSREGLALLFKYLEECDPDMELDVIALCCDYNEDTVEGIAKNYGLELPEDETEKEHRQAVFDYLSDHTAVIGETPWGIVYANF